MSENLDNNGGQQQMMAPASNGMATGALIIGIISLVFSFIPLLNILCWILGILAIVFGIIGMVKAGKMNGLGKSKALTGLILGVVSIVLFYVVNIMFINAAADNFESEFNNVDWEQTMQDAIDDAQENQ